MGLTLLRVPKFLRVRSFFLAVIIYAVGILIKPADAVSDNLNKNLTQGATTQVTPTKAARRKASATKKISKTSSPSKGAPKISPVERGDARIRWDKKWGPLVPHKTFPKKCDLCHVPKRWDVMRPDFHFDHLKETGYALEGAHAEDERLLEVLLVDEAAGAELVKEVASEPNYQAAMDAIKKLVAA